MWHKHEVQSMLLLLCCGAQLLIKNHGVLYRCHENQHLSHKVIFLQKYHNGIPCKYYCIQLMVHHCTSLLS